MGETRNQVNPVAAKQMDGFEVEGDGIHFDRLPKLIVPENPFKMDELLEASDWWDFLLRPAKIVQVAGRLVKIRFLGFSPEMEQWVDVFSRDIYPMDWGDLREFPMQVPLNFEL